MAGAARGAYLNTIPCVTSVDQSFRFPLRLPRNVAWERFFAGATIRTKAQDDLSLLDLAPWSAAVRSAGWSEPVAKKLVDMMNEPDLDPLNRLRAALTLRYLRQLGRANGLSEPEDDQGPIFDEFQQLIPEAVRRPRAGNAPPSHADPTSAVIE
jgi:hypothetical protein